MEEFFFAAAPDRDESVAAAFAANIERGRPGLGFHIFAADLLAARAVRTGFEIPLAVRQTVRCVERFANFLFNSA
ncbi:MAG: hypothetical protein JSS81_08605 [Acidobacteria bacterium]|nr:hypothetical protein [Acidobacteriota bacterium]